MEELEICLALERLRRLSDEETTSVIGVCEEIENTTEVLMVNQPIFTNLHPSQIDKMINKIDESTCHIEDVIMAHGHGKKYNKEKVSSIIFEIRQLHKQIKETADNTRDDSRLGFTMDEERERNEGERTAIFDPDDFIGPLEEVDHVVNRLIDTERNGEAEAISLCGPGGVGKTAFARKVWNDPRIALGFFHMMWIRVSSKVDIKNILLDVIRHFERKTDGINNMSEYELAERIKSCIRKGGRCLIVLDDVWSTQVLDKVQCLFRDKHRILLTTRKRQVAEYGIPKPFIYTLRGLSPENAWELFAKSFPPGYWRRRPDQDMKMRYQVWDSKDQLRSRQT